MALSATEREVSLIKGAILYRLMAPFNLRCCGARRRAVGDAVVENVELGQSDTGRAAAKSERKLSDIERPVAEIEAHVLDNGQQVAEDSQEPRLYEPLNRSKSEVRVVVLESVDDQAMSEAHGNIETLVLGMKTISLDDSDHPSFNTLSYVWGELMSNSTVIINGFNVKVTQNLHLALHDLFRSNTNLLLWVDALCIDQSNMQERGSQVQMMSRIYGSSARTVAHLGSFPPGPALRLLEELATRRRQPNPAVWIIHAAEDVEWADGWKGLEAFIQLPYWTRVWILQETTVSPQLEIFNLDGPWLSVERLLEAFMFVRLTKNFIRDLLHKGPGVYLGHRFDSLQSQMGLRYRYIPDGSDQSVHPLPIVGVLLTALRLRATNPRDHLYAILAMVEDGNEIIGTPNYDRSLAQVFAMFTEHYRKQYGSLDMVLLSLFPRQLVDTPSWIPDLSSFEGSGYRNTLLQENLRSVTKPQGQKPMSDNMHFAASGNLFSNAIFSPNYDKLVTPGTRLGLIEGLGGWTVMVVEHRDVGNFSDDHPCDQDLRLCHDNSRLFGDVVEALAHSLILSSIPTITSAFPPGLLSQILLYCAHSVVEEKLESRYLFGFNKWWENSKNLSIGGSPLSEWLLCDGMSSTVHKDQVFAMLSTAKLERVIGEVNAEFMIDSFLSRLSHVTMEMHRRLFVTGDGRIGVAGTHCRRWDEVWVLQGCSLPVVLRPTHVKGQYELQGEAFVYGSMNGEALPRLKYTADWITLV